MTVLETTYALARPLPYLLVRGLSQTIDAPIRYGSTGGLITPDSGTVTVLRPDGTALVSEAAVTISSSVAAYTFSPSASETLGALWQVIWTLVIGGVTYPSFRQEAYLCQYLPPNNVSVLDLYRAMPELEARIPQRQGDRGDGTGWQPQIDETYYELLQRMIDDARKPWDVIGITGAREWAIARTVQRCVMAIPHGADSQLGQSSKELSYQVERLWGRMRLQYAEDAQGYRRATVPTVRLAPAGRVTS